MNPPEAMPRHELERKLRRSRSLNAVLAVVAIAALVFGGAQWASGSRNGADASVAAGSDAEAAARSGGETSAAMQLERRIEGDPMALGSIDAPIVMSEWIDFRCPFCAVFTRETLPKIVQEYVDEGKVRIEVHDVAYFGEQSERAAAAARAAGEQGKYFEFVYAVYGAAPESGHPELPAEQLIAFAKQVGVADIERFEREMQSEQTLQAVRESTAQAQQLGVSGVPFFAVNGQALSGAQPIEGFRQFLDRQLAGE